jgi:guanylate kinase
VSSGLLIVSGPSGAGKGTVLAALMQRLPDAHVAVSVTTRPPRPTETDGVDYTFIDDDAFDEAVRDGCLLEHARYAGHRYGTPRSEVAADRLTVIECDFRGAMRLREVLPHARSVFLAPPSLDALRERLEQRGTESRRQIGVRLRRARAEMACANQVYDHVVVNDDVARACEEILALVQIATSSARA